MANYVLGIVSHKDRRAMTVRLDAAVHADIALEDDGTLGATGNHLAVLRACLQESVAQGANWVVVLEDDALPVPGFHQQLSAALDVSPSSVVSLYNGTGYPAQRQHQFKALTHRDDVCWILHPYMRHAVAYALHREVFELGIIDTVTAFHGQQYAPDDAISKWCLRYGQPVAYSNPSLVEHDDLTASVIKVRKHLGIVTPNQRRRPRRAHWTGTRMSWNGRSENIS